MRFTDIFIRRPVLAEGQPVARKAGRHERLGERIQGACVHRRDAGAPDEALRDGDRVVGGR